MVQDQGQVDCSGDKLLWKDEDGSGDGFGYNWEFENLLNEYSGNSSKKMKHDDGGGDDDKYSVCGLECNEAVNKRIRLTPKLNDEEVNLANAMLNSRPIGLKLQLTSSLLDSVEKKLNFSAKSTDCQAKVDDLVSQLNSEKLKASNFPATLLRIGTWERISRNEGDLVAKCYFAKKKVVWEILERGLKSKIEIQWSDIIGLRSFIQEDHPGILEVELSRPPTFFIETNPQPRKHTIWKSAADFTVNYQATLCRRHYLMFQAGYLDRHYEKLLQHDRRLFVLSKKPFPTHQSPFFPPDEQRFNFSYSTGYGTDINHRLHCPFSSVPSPLVTAANLRPKALVPQSCYLEPSSPIDTLRVQSYESVNVNETHSPISVIDFSPLNENVRGNVFERRRVAAWGRGVNNPAESLARDPVILSTVFSPSQVNSANSCQNCNLPYAQVADQKSNFDAARQLNEIENNFLEGFNKPLHLPRVDSLTSLINLAKEENSASEINGQSYEEQPISDMFLPVFCADEQPITVMSQQVLDATDCANGIGTQCYQFPVFRNEGSPPYQQQPISCTSPLNEQANIVSWQAYQHQRPFSFISPQVYPKNMHQPGSNLCYTSGIADPAVDNLGHANTMSGFSTSGLDSFDGVGR